MNHVMSNSKFRSGNAGTARGNRSFGNMVPMFLCYLKKGKSGLNDDTYRERERKKERILIFMIFLQP